MSDCRRKTDLDFFQSKFAESSRVVQVRTSASEETRVERGFVFQTGVDDAESECGLDDEEEWDLVISNDGEANAKVMLKPLLEEAEKERARKS